MAAAPPTRRRWADVIAFLSPLRSRRWAALWVALAINALLLVLYVWSRGGSTVDVRVEAKDNTYAAYVDDRLIGAGTLGELGEGGVAFTFSRSAKIPSLPGPTGLDWVRITDLDTGEVLVEDDFEGEAASIWRPASGAWHSTDGVLAPEDRRGTISTGDQPWRNYKVEAKLRNPIDVTVTMRDQGSRNRFAFGIQPFQTFRSSFRVTENGTTVLQRDGLRLQLDRVETARSMLAMLLRPYPIALLMVLGAAGLAFAVRFAPFERAALAFGRGVLANGGAIVAVFSLWAVVFLAYVLYVIGDAMPHVPDSTAYVFQSKIFASFRLTADQPPAFESFSFFHPPMLKVVDGRWFSQYPFGHPLVLSIGQVLHVPWLVPPIVGALCIALIYLTGRKVYGGMVGLVAAALLLFSPFFQMTASNFMSHNTGAFAVVACLFFLTRPIKQRMLSMFLAGLFAGLLFNIRPLSAVAFILVLGAFHAYELSRSSAEDRKQVFMEQLALGAGGLVMLLAYFGYNLATTGTVQESGYALQGTYSENTFGFGGTHSLAVGIQNQQTHLALLLLVANGWPAAFGLVFAMLPFVLGTRHRWDYFLLAAFVVVAAAQALYVRAPIMHGPRFWYETMPFLMLLSARGVQMVIERSGEIGGWLSRNFGFGGTRPPGVGIAGTAVLGLAAGLVAFSAWGWMLEKRDGWAGVRFTPQNISMLEGFNFTDDRLLDAADDLDLDNALVFVEKCSQWWCYGSVFWTNSVDLDGNTVWVERQTNRDDITILERYPQRDVYLANYDARVVTSITREDIIESVEAQEAMVVTSPSDPDVVAARDEERVLDLESLREPLERYRAAHGGYPDTGNRLQTLCLVREVDIGCALESVVPELPSDPLGASTSRGYWYVSDGTRYILIAAPEGVLESADVCPSAVLDQANGRPRYCLRGGEP